MRDDGVACAKGEAYGRGAGYPWHASDPVNDSAMFKRCEKDNGAGKCEKNGLIVYPKCETNYHAVACGVCSPNCPAGMTDIGVSCSKQSYGRTAGVPIHACPATMEKDGAFAIRSARTVSMAWGQYVGT